MSDGLVKIEISGFKELTDKIDAARLVVKDLRPLWELFASDFYKSEKEIFSLKGPGKYVDLSPRYKAQKKRAVGFLYPVLFRTGELALSLLSRNARGSVFVATPQAMVLGTRVRHAGYHHSTEPRRKIPRRPLWQEEPDSPMYKRWNRIADKFFEKAVQGAFDGKGGPGKIYARGD